MVRCPRDQSLLIGRGSSPGGENAQALSQRPPGTTAATPAPGRCAINVRGDDDRRRIVEPARSRYGPALTRSTMTPPASSGADHGRTPQVTTAVSATTVALTHSRTSFSANL